MIQDEDGIKILKKSLVIINDGYELHCKSRSEKHDRVYSTKLMMKNSTGIKEYLTPKKKIDAEDKLRLIEKLLKTSNEPPIMEETEELEEKSKTSYFEGVACLEKRTTKSSKKTKEMPKPKQGKERNFEKETKRDIKRQRQSTLEKFFL